MTDLKTIGLNSSATVTLDQEYYIYSALSLNSTFTYNLPQITADGMRFSFSRRDLDSTSILIISSSFDLITRNSTTFSFISLDILSGITLISKTNLWYIIENTANTIENTGSILSGGFVANNGNIYQQFSGNVVNKIVSRFSYPGSGSITAKSLFIAISVVNGPFGINFKLTRPDGTEVSSNTLIVFNSTTYPTLYTISNIFNSLIPSGLTYLNLVLSANGGGNTRVRVHSFILN